jgi:hypothetical protein
MVVIHLCVKLSILVVSMATAGILKFPSLKTIYAHAIQHFVVDDGRLLKSLFSCFAY